MAVVRELFIYSQIIPSSDPESLVSDASDANLTRTEIKTKFHDLTSQLVTVVADIFHITI